MTAPTLSSRRALLAAAFGGAAAAAAGALARPVAVRANVGDGSSLDIGEANSGTTVTEITNSTDAAVAFHAKSSATAGATSALIGEITTGLSATSAGVKGVNSTGVGVRGTSVNGSGVAGDSDFGTGAYGVSTDGVGVWGESVNGYGVRGVTTNGQSAGVYGAGTPGRGVYGYSESTDGVVGESFDDQSAGVRGYSNGYGVWGASTLGTGVGGSSSDGIAVSGYSSSATKATIVGQAAGQTPGAERTGVMGYSGQTPPTSGPAKTGVYGYATQDSNARGVHGRSTGGSGVYGQATTGAGLYGVATTGYALRTSGRLKLEKTSGSVVIASPATVSSAIFPGVALSSSSLVIATIQGNGGANVGVKRVNITNGAAGVGSFTITLTAAPTTNVKVAWLLLN
jgi:hypothetical protein